MVHRPADSRLLANLLSQEKDYAKHLGTFLDHSNASLASVTAYASASSPDSAHIILTVAASLASADDALRHYAAAVDRWRDYLKGLKALEDEVGNIMRDREILVTRLIKASKPTSYSPSPTQSQTSLASTSNSKLAAAQTELQACEAHLATKEVELRVHRSALVSEGLAQRCRALAECGQRWSEAGRVGAMTAESGAGAGAGSPLRASSPVPNQNKPLPGVAGSDISLAPSQSASQINLFPSTHIYSDSGLPPPSSAEDSSLGHHHHSDMALPAAHAMADLAVPFLQRPLARRITEEDLLLYNEEGEGSSAGEEEASGTLKVVENPRFAAANRSGQVASSRTSLLKRPDPLKRQPTYGGSTLSVPVKSTSGFFGTIRGIFGRRTGSDYGAGAGGRRGKARDIDEESGGMEVRNDPPTIRSRVLSDVGSRRGRGLLGGQVGASPTEEWVDGQGLLLAQKQALEERGWASDGGVASAPAPVKRKKSLKKQGTVRSVSSAQSDSTAGGDLVILSPRQKRRASLGVTASSSLPAAALVPPIPPPMTTKAERRQTMPIHPHPRSPAEPASLMSIVESVSRANRDGWAAHDKPENGANGSTSAIIGLPEVKAPRLDSVVVPRGRSASTGTVIEGLPRAPGSIFSTPAVPSTFAGPSAPQSSGTSSPASSLKRPAVSPLRSALRTSSPPPAPLPVPTFLPIKAPVPISAAVPVLIPVAAPVPNGTGDVNGKGKEKAEPVGDDSDDAVSISSYETGHEMFGDGDGDETEHEEDHGPPPSPPPHDYGHVNGKVNGNGNGTVIHESPVQSHQLIEDYGNGGSDLSASSASTQTGAAALPRRKSVRVSLQPTFSTTPPAIDEDDDEAGSLHAPWQERGERKPEVDMWEDSSEEDIEYQRAKKLLNRASRKDKKK